MPEQMIEEYKNRVRKQVGLMFAFLVVALVVGLYAVQERAKDYAADQATKSAHAQLEAQRYQTNFTACGVRALVAPGLKALHTALERAKQSAVDQNLPLSSRKRSAAAVKSTEKQIKDTNNVLALFGTIPPGFDCKDLPKKAPKFE